MKVGYKLTDRKYKSYGGMYWGENITHSAKEGKLKFCTATAIHYYEHPLLAAFCNPIHSSFKNPILWEGEVHGETMTDGLKCICKKFTTIRQIPLPEITLKQQVEIAIRCAMRVYKDPEWLAWADSWLSDQNRTPAAAGAAARATVEAASWAVWAAEAASVAAARAAEAASEAAAWAARSAANVGIPLLQIIKEIVE